MLHQYKPRRVLLIALLLLFIGATLLLFVQGPLFPFSPVICGFRSHTFARAAVYYHDGTPITAFADIDALMGEVESFHQMHYKAQVKLFVCGSTGEFKRLTWGSRGRLVTFPPYGRIFVSARAMREALSRQIHLRVYLKHELSHALLQQNTPLRRCNALPVWLGEGLAVYSAGQLGCDHYPSADDIRHDLRQGYFFPPEDCGMAAACLPEDVKRQPALVREAHFWYAESACLVGDLIHRYGKARFFQFVNLLMQQGTASADFSRVFGISFVEYTKGFRQRWSQPAPQVHGSVNPPGTAQW